MSTLSDLHVALTMYAQVSDNDVPGLSAKEMECIRTKRVNEVARIAVQLQREVAKVVTR